MKLTIGGIPSNILSDMLREAGVAMNDYAREYMRELELHAIADKVTLDVCFITPASLGLSEGGSLSQIYAAAACAGFSLCPPDTAIYLRLMLADQPQSSDSILSAGRCPDGAITVASPSIGNNPGLHKGLYLRNIDGRLWLRGYTCNDEYIWPENSLFAFAAAAQE